MPNPDTSKTKANFPVLQLTEGKLSEQVYHAVRTAIIDGRLQEKMKIPSSRALSEMMSVSRNTVLAGLERLIDEGYLISKAGSGTFVAYCVPEVVVSAHMAEPLPDYLLTTDTIGNQHLVNVFSKWQQYDALNHQAKMFGVGSGCHDLFPKDTWGRLLGRVWRHNTQSLAKENDMAGFLPLRFAIAQYIKSTRGVVCNASQVMIVNGTQQALRLSMQVLLNQGDCVLMGEPSYDNAVSACALQGMQVNTIPSDGEGMLVAEARNRYPQTQLIYTTPSQQFPLSNTLSLPRRLLLLEWAIEQKKWIFEDDYNGEFRYQSRAIQALQGIDTQQRVIYSGTFSKMMYAGFRLGFLVVPKSLCHAFQAAKHYSDSEVSLLEQRVMAEFIQSGEYARHVRRVRKTCLERKQVLLEAIARYLPHVFKVEDTDSGIHVLAWLQEGVQLEQIMHVNRVLNFGMLPLQKYSQEKLQQDAVLIGYAAHTSDTILRGIEQFSVALQSILSD